LTGLGRLFIEQTGSSTHFLEKRRTRWLFATRFLAFSCSSTWSIA
jgi:hypothetical protein